MELMGGFVCDFIMERFFLDKEKSERAYMIASFIL